MDAEKRVKLHIGELTVTIHAQQAQIEQLEAKVKELEGKRPPHDPNVQPV